MTTTETLVRTPDLLRTSGLTSRQLSYWIERGVLRPSSAPSGQGTPLEWAPSEVDTARLLRRLLEAGLTQGAIPSVIDKFRRVPAEEPGFDAFLGAGLWISVTREA